MMVFGLELERYTSGSLVGGGGGVSHLKKK